MNPQAQRWIIEQQVELISPLHLSTGEDRQRDDGQWLPTLAEDYLKQPWMPGASIKGALRAFAKRTGLTRQLEISLFGNDGEERQSGAILFLGGTTTAAKNRINRTRVAIDRQTGTAVDKKLFAVEAIDIGTRFTLKYIVENKGETEVKALLDLLEQAPQDSLFALGAFTNQGFGQVKNAGPLECKRFGPDEMRAWLKANATKPWQHYATPYTPSLSKALDSTNLCQLKVTVLCTAPFIVKKPTDKTRDVNTIQPQLRHNKALLPSSSLRGRLRTQAERILRTLTPEADIQQGHEPAAHRKGEALQDLATALFGTAGWKGLIAISDFIDEKPSELETQEMIAIDRFVGGGKDGAKFAVEYAVNPILEGNLSINLPRWKAMEGTAKTSTQARAALGLLSLVLRDWAEGDIPLGFGASKGFGKNHSPTLLSDWEKTLRHIPQYKDTNTPIASTLDDLRLYLELPNPIQAQIEGKGSSTQLAGVPPKQKINTQGKDKQEGFHNPYHFIPLTQTEASTWPRFDQAKQERGHHQYTGLSGKIICQIKLSTPVFVGNKQTESTNDLLPSKAEHYQYNGELAFPGTSLRGMISSLFEPISRSNMRVLSNSTYKTRNANNKKDAVLKTTAEMLASFDRNLLPYGLLEREAKLSPVELLFGFVEDKKETGSPQHIQAAAIAGRVRISHALPAEGTVLQQENPIRLKELSSPSPIDKKDPTPVAPFYFTKYNTTLKQLGQPLKKRADMLVHNSAYGPKGWKRYLHALRNLGSAQQAVYQLTSDGTINNKDGKMPWVSHAAPDGNQRRMQVSPLKQGQELYFDIEFENLTQTELAQLCATLTPNDHFEHKLGLGKPIGLGSIKITPLRLLMVNRATRYSEDGLDAPRYHQVWANPHTPLENKRYQAEANLTANQDENLFAQLVSEGLDSTTPEVRNALQLTGDPRWIVAPVHYPQQSGESLETELFKWFNWIEKDGLGGLENIAPNQERLNTLRRS